MKLPLVGTTVMALFAALLTSCSTVSSMLPFGSDGPKARSTVPADATEYQCNGGRHFYLRNLDNGAAVWVIFSDREVRLDKAADSSTRYSNGPATLELAGGEAKLADGTSSYTGCKPATKP